MDYLCKRFADDLGDNFTLILTEGMTPKWWRGARLVTVDYHFNHRSKLSVAREIARLLDALPPSTVIMESIPIPIRSLQRHKHFQCAYDLRYFYGFSKSRLYRVLFTRYLKYQWRHCQHIVTCSEASVEELEHHVGFPRDRVVISPFGITDTIFETPHVELDAKRYDLIYVGHFDRHKNHAPLIDALGMMDKALKVLFIGVDNGLLASLKARAAGLGLTNVAYDTIRDEREVWNRYARSKVFVSPSLYEGFGMPTIEALALGLPIVLSDIKVFREVGQEFATYFDPLDARDIAEKLSAVLENPVAPDHAKVRAHLDQFSWKNIYARLRGDLRIEGSH